MDENNLIDKRDNALEEMGNNEELIEYIKQLNERITSIEDYDERKTFEEKISKRQEYNYKCLDILKEFIDKYPDWRFTQIIFNLGLAEDRFYQESVDTYELMKMAKAYMKI